MTANCILSMVLVTLASCGKVEQTKGIVPSQAKQPASEIDTLPSSSQDGVKTSTKQSSEEPVDGNAINLVKLTLGIQQIRGNDGQICISVFDGPEGWPFSAEKAIFESCIGTSVAQQNFELALLPNKKYAIAIFHDANSNGDLDRAPGIGIPLEGFGFSSNPPLKIGAPSFDEVAISLGEQSTSANIKLLYLL